MNIRRSEFWPIAALLLLGSLAFVRTDGAAGVRRRRFPVAVDLAGHSSRRMAAALGRRQAARGLADGALGAVGFSAAAGGARHACVAGMLAVVLTYGSRWNWEIGSRRPVSAVLLAVCPFLVYLQRLALSDVFLCAAGAWVLLSMIRFVRSPGTAPAVKFACSLVLAVFCKFPVGFVFLIALPLALLWMPPDTRQNLLRRPALTKVIASQVPVGLLVGAVAAIAVVRLERGLAPGFGLQDFLGIGLGGYVDVAQGIGIAPPRLLTELAAQLTWPVVALGAVGLAASAMYGDWRQRWLVAVGLTPLLAIGFLASFWFSRYLLFTLPPLIIAAVCGWRSLSSHAGRLRRPLQGCALALCAVLMGRQSALIILNPVAANWSPLDRFQYVEGWTSGYGYPQAAQFLLTRSDAPAVIYSLDGHSAYQLLTYLPADWRGRVTPVIYGSDGRELRSQDARFENLLSRTPAWIISPEPLLAQFMESRFGRLNADKVDLQAVAVFDKPGLRTRLGLYEITQRAR